MTSYYLQALDTLLYLLEKNNNHSQWIEWLKKDYVDFDQYKNVDHHLLAYGGMESFNDVHLSQLNQQEIIIFDIMKAYCYRFAFLYKRIHEDTHVLEKDVLDDILCHQQKSILLVLILDGLQRGNFLEFYLQDCQQHNRKNITFYRQSVCMADDINDNTKVYSCHVDWPYQSILTVIKVYNFLPQVDGDDVVWVALNAKGKEVFSYFTQSNRCVLISNKQTIEDVCEGDYEIHFQYYCSPHKRGEQLFQLYKGDISQMKRAGGFEEYEYCLIISKKEI